MEYLKGLFIVICVFLVGMTSWAVYQQNNTIQTASNTAQPNFQVHTTQAASQKSIPQNALRIQVEGVLYEGFRVDLTRHQMAFFYQNPQGQPFRNFGELKRYLDSRSVKLQFATNAGMFNPKFEPNGLYVEEGKELFPLNLKKGQGNFYMQPNGVFFITSYGTANIIPSTDYAQVRSVVRFATQSGPLLLIKGVINPKFKADSPNKYIRSGVGLVDKEHLVCIISRQAVNLYEFARIFKQKFGCKEALYLDGAISKMYIPAIQSYESDGIFGAIIAIIQ